jgi:hypothetical protein
VVAQVGGGGKTAAGSFTMPGWALPSGKKKGIEWPAARHKMGPFGGPPSFDMLEQRRMKKKPLGYSFSYSKSSIVQRDLFKPHNKYNHNPPTKDPVNPGPGKYLGNGRSELNSTSKYKSVIAARITKTDICSSERPLFRQPPNGAPAVTHFSPKHKNLPRPGQYYLPEAQKMNTKAWSKPCTVSKAEVPRSQSFIKQKNW